MNYNKLVSAAIFFVSQTPCMHACFALAFIKNTLYSTPPFRFLVQISPELNRMAACCHGTYTLVSDKALGMHTSSRHRRIGPPRRLAAFPSPSQMLCSYLHADKIHHTAPPPQTHTQFCDWDQLRPCLVPKNFTNFFRFSVKSNL